VHNGMFAVSMFCVKLVCFMCLLMEQLGPGGLTYATWVDFTLITCISYWQCHVKTRRLSLFGHIARMNESTDASRILFEPPLDVWTKPRGRPRNSWVWASGSKGGCSGPGLLEDVYEA